MANLHKIGFSPLDAPVPKAMKAEEVLALVEQACDRHFNPLQTTILRQTWQDQSYQDIASSTGYEVGYIKQMGAQLWRQLSESFGERVTKSNLHEVLRRQAQSLSPWPRIPEPQPIASLALESTGGFHSVSAMPRTDWDDAPAVPLFYGREAEQAKVAQWLTRDRCRFVSILGMGGIGKTSLAIQVARQVQNQFDWVIWRSLQHQPPLQEFLSDVLRALGQASPDRMGSPEQLLRALLQQLRQSRGLLILDNAESLMQPGNLAGYYPTGYENYGQLWRYLGDRDHQSSVLLTSREPPHEINLLTGPHLPVRRFHLSGISPQIGQQLVQGQGEFAGTPTDWQTLVHHYGGNPLALKMVADVILSCFEGQLAAFLALSPQGSSIFADLRQLLAGQFDRISPLERDVLYWLAIHREPVTLNDLRDPWFPAVAIADLLAALTSLQARSLIEKQMTRFTLQPVVMEYVTDCLIDQVYAELEILAHGTFQPQLPPAYRPLLHTHPLLVPHAPDYRREAQRRILLQAIADRCVARGIVSPLLKEIQAQLEHGRGRPQLGYLGGNLLNLLIQLQVDLTGWDFSHWSIWQADLRGVALHQVNLTGADVRQSAFTEAFSQVLSVAFSPDGKLLATGDVNHEVRIWQVAEGKPLLTLQMAAGWVWSVAFSPQGRLLASSANRTVALWDLQTGTRIYQFHNDADRVFSLAFSPDGQLLASGSEDRLIRVWEVKTRRLIRVLKGHDDEVRSVAFAPHRYVEATLGTPAAQKAAGHLLASGSYDRTVRLWDVQSGTCTQILKGHQDWVETVAFSPDGQTLASGSRDRTLHLWDSQTGTLQSGLAHPQPIRALAFAPDGKTLASGCDDYRIRLWHYQTGDCLRVLTGHQSWIAALAFSHDNGLLASGSEDQSVRLWDGLTHRCIKTLQGHSNGVWAIAFSPQGQQIASGHQDGQIRLWSISPPSGPQSLSGHTSWVWSVAFSPDGTHLASGSEDRTIRLWNAQTGAPLHTLCGHEDAVFAVVFSLDGRTLISGSLDGKLRLWDLETRQCHRLFSGHRGGIWAIALSANGQYLASGSQDGTTRLWDIATGTCLQVLACHPGWIRCVAFSPDGQLLATGSADGLIELWDLTQGTCQAWMAQSGPVLALAFDPRQPRLVSSGTDATLQFWHWQRQPDHTLQVQRLGSPIHQAHDRWVRGLAYSPDGQILASCSQDERIKLWSYPFSPTTSPQVLQVPRPYEGMTLSKITGLTPAQRTTLQRLGATATVGAIAAGNLQA